MRKVFAPALMAVMMTALCSSDASAFGLLDKLCGKSSCDACAEPTCGCEPVVPMCEPTCGCEMAPEPCCDSAPRRPKFALLKKLFHKHNACDDCCAPACEPTCGCEVIEPACGCEIVEPSCGCGVPGPCGCEDPCARPSCGSKIKGFFGKLFHKKHACDDCCAPACEPTCGCEPSCGFEPAPACGCGM